MLRLGCSLPLWPGHYWQFSLRLVFYSVFSLVLALVLVLVFKQRNLDTAASSTVREQVGHASALSHWARSLLLVHNSSNILNIAFWSEGLIRLQLNSRQTLQKHPLPSWTHPPLWVETLCLGGHLEWRHQAGCKAWAVTRWRQDGCSPSKERDGPADTRWCSCKHSHGRDPAIWA